MNAPAQAATAESATAQTTTAQTGTADYRLGLQTQDRETAVEALAVDGTLPAWLIGSLIRTGPALFEAGARRVNHWFDGFAMLHRFGFADGRVSYANRFLQTRAYRAAAQNGEIAYSEFATDPCRTLFRRVASTFSPALTDNAAVNVVRLGEEYIAMTETPLPVAFEPATLRTLGVTGWAKALRGQTTTAHPHRDPSTGGILNYATHFGPATKYRIYSLAPGAAKPEQIAAIPVRHPSYMHSFAVTQRYVVLAEFPLVVNPVSLALSGRPFIENYEWQPERGTTFTVVDRADGSVRARVDGPAMFCFHHVNAFEDGDRLVLDMSVYEDASIVEALYLDRLHAAEPVPHATLWRYRVPLGPGEAVGEQLAPESLELPRIDYRSRNGRRYRYAYGAGAREPGDFLNQLVKVDVDAGESRTWSEPDCYPGEPVFVAAPDQRAEDDGVILSVVLDARAETSFLLVLDAGSFEQLARAHAPLRIPFGFHGSFFRD
jgi:carotenoid cleavage dioxygenase-like enzyme